MTAKQQGAFYTGQYRNLFAECGYSEIEIEEQLHKAWHAVFEDPETRFYFEDGVDAGYMVDTGNHDVRTEGMSYGMMMAVQTDRKEIFDRLWTWSMRHMYMEHGVHAGYFAWSCNLDGSKRAWGPAPDGEEYYAMALFFASQRWGDGEGLMNYSGHARKLLSLCVHRGEQGYDEGHPMWNRDNKLIKFIPEVEFSDPSYHLPHYYELFALWAEPADRDFWREAAEASRHYLHLSCHPVTGLSPEYAHYDGTPNDERGFGHFFSDAYRVAANIGLDWEWFAADEWQRGQAERLLSFFVEQDPADYRRYTIAGEPFEEKALHPVGLLAANAVAALAAPWNPRTRAAVELLWNTPPRTGDRRYYDNCLHLFAMLALSGRYRIWRRE